MKIGYVRVSDKSQNTDRQVNKMLKLGIEDRFLFIDEMSGKDFNRPRFQAMLQAIRPGDIIYFDALDRLGREYDGILKNWKYITRELQADIVVLENEDLFDSRKFRNMGDHGKLLEDQFLSLLAYAAEQERKRIKRRQREGIENAKRNGVKLGRPTINLSSLSKGQLTTLKTFYPKWKNKEITGVLFAKKLGLKKNTFYKIIKQYENNLKEQTV